MLSLGPHAHQQDVFTGAADGFTGTEDGFMGAEDGFTGVVRRLDRMWADQFGISDQTYQL
jgi:hypothetical protein